MHYPKKTFPECAIISQVNELACRPSTSDQAPPHFPRRFPTTKFEIETPALCMTIKSIQHIASQPRNPLHLVS